MPTLIQRIRQFIYRYPEWYYTIQENAMGYRSYDQMFADYYSMYMLEKEPLYLNEYGEQFMDKQLKQAMTVYGRAGRPKLDFLIIGRKARQQIFLSRRGIIGHMEISTPEKPLIDLDMIDNLKALDEKKNKRGSIINSDNWTFLMNDLFISGGVANQKSFYLASPRTVDNLWDRSERHITIFGREIAGLFAAGYELIHLQDGSEAMIPPCTGNRPLDLYQNNRGLNYFLEGDNLGFIAHRRIHRFNYDDIERFFEPVFYE